MPKRGGAAARLVIICGCIAPILTGLGGCTAIAPLLSYNQGDPSPISSNFYKGGSTMNTNFWREGGQITIVGKPKQFGSVSAENFGLFRFQFRCFGFLPFSVFRPKHYFRPKQPVSAKIPYFGCTFQFKINC